jgi:RNA-binding protein
MRNAADPRNELPGKSERRKDQHDMSGLPEHQTYAIHKGAEKMKDKEAKKEVMRRALEIDPTVHVGKDGLKDSLYEEIKAQLKKAHIVKVKVLSNVDDDVDEIAKTISEATESVVVDVRGGVMVLSDKRTWDSLCQKKI